MADAEPQQQMPELHPVFSRMVQCLMADDVDRLTELYHPQVEWTRFLKVVRCRDEVVRALLDDYNKLSWLTRRGFLAVSAGAVGAATLGACSSSSSPGFHDGTPVRAAEVAFTFKTRARAPRARNPDPRHDLDKTR